MAAVDSASGNCLRSERRPTSLKMRGERGDLEGTSEMAFTNSSGEGDGEGKARMKCSLASETVVVAEPGLRATRCERPERRSGTMGARVFR